MWSVLLNLCKGNGPVKTKTETYCWLQKFMNLEMEIRNRVEITTILDHEKETQPLWTHLQDVRQLTGESVVFGIEDGQTQSKKLSSEISEWLKNIKEWCWRSTSLSRKAKY